MRRITEVPRVSRKVPTKDQLLVANLFGSLSVVTKWCPICKINKTISSFYQYFCKTRGIVIYKDPCCACWDAYNGKNPAKIEKAATTTLEKFME